MRVRDRISRFFYQDPGFIDWIRRLTGLWLLIYLPIECLTALSCDPYHVPSWRSGNLFIAFPEPPALLTLAVWALSAFACVGLICGVRNRLLPLFLFAVWLCYETLERNVFNITPLITLSLYLLALFIDRKPRSLSRRIIQVAVSSCYVYSALQKFHPEFLHGFTLHEILGRGCLVRTEILPAIHWLELPWWFTQLTSYMVIAAELFIGLGLWFPFTRRLAVFCGIVFHVLFTLVLPGTGLLGPTMWTGYLAFFDRRGLSPSRRFDFKKPLLDIFIASLAVFCCIFIPLRFFLLSPFVWVNLSLYDRVPWGHSMFLFNEEIEYVGAFYWLKSGNVFRVPLDGRMKYAASSSELIALAHYLKKIHPDAVKIKVVTALRVNNHSERIKELFYVPGENKLHMHMHVLDGMQLRRRL